MIRSIARSAAPLVLAAVSLLPMSGRAQGTPAQPENDTTRRVDAVFAQWNRQDSPGCALGVYHNGTIAYSHGYGMADLERRVPITPRTIFDIGSTSKQFSAAAIVLLAQDGKLTLDDDVRKWIPEFPDYGKVVTIRHLLLHTSGLRDYIGLLTLSGARIDDVTDADDALRIILRQKELNFDPGAEHLYSNSGYFLLSVIVQRASGKTLQAFARERIFTPLGMTRTHYLASYNDIVPDRAIGYSPRSGGGLRQDLPRWLQVGDGAVFTTVEELLLWDNNFYDPKVGGASLVADLQKPGALGSGRPLTYALGLSNGTYRGQATVSHGGSWGGYRAELLRFPAQHLSIATLCNLATIDPTALSYRVADVYLEGVLAPANKPAAAETPAVKVPPDVLAGYAGVYRNPVTRGRLRFAVADGQFVVTGDSRFELRAQTNTVFGTAGSPTTWTFEGGADDGPLRMTRRREGAPAEIFERLPGLKLTAAELATYTGQFYSAELDATFTVAVVDGALLVRPPRATPFRLEPVVRDEFMAGTVTVRFTRGSDAVAGYLLDLGRIRNLRFDRRP